MITLLTGAMLALTLGVGDTNGDITLGEIREYGDWVSGCDNALSCEAISVGHTGARSYAPSLIVSRQRAAAKGVDGAPLNIRMEGLNSNIDRYSILIDGQVVDTGAIDQDRKEISIVSLDAVRLAGAIARGNNMQVVDGAGQSIALFSLKGSAASLRLMDTKLGLAGTRQGIVAQGQRKASHKEAQLPLVHAKRVGLDGRVPEAADLIKFGGESQCHNERFGVTEDRSYSLGRHGDIDQALVLLSCGSGTYNFVSAAFVASSTANGEWTFAPATFDLPPKTLRGPKDVPLMINADWDSDNQSLSSFAMDRGLADCGDQSQYVWDGEKFRLTEVRSMPSCRGTLNWITIYRTKIVFDG